MLRTYNFTSISKTAAPCHQRLAISRPVTFRPLPRVTPAAVKDDGPLGECADLEELWEEQYEEDTDRNEQLYDSSAQSSPEDYRMQILEDSSSGLGSIIAGLSAVVVGGVLFSRMRGRNTPSGQAEDETKPDSVSSDDVAVTHGSTAAAAAALEAAFSGSSSSKTRQTGKMATMSRTMLSFLIDELRGSAAVDLSGKNLMDEGVEYVAEGLAYNQTCKSARFSSNAVGDKACYQLSEVLKVNVTLQDLYLDTNQIGDTAATYLASMLATNATLRRVGLSANRIADEGAAALAEMLSSNSSLRHLDLSCNEIGYTGCVALAKALTKNSTLATLNISDNYITALGGGALAEALSQNSGLRSLAVKGSTLGDSVAERLCLSLAEREAPLEELDLSNNDLTEASAPHLATLLRATPLKKLNLNMNALSTAGMYALADALKATDTLEELDLGGNNISSEGAQVLMHALRGKTSLRVLELGYNPLEDEGVKAVVEVAKYDLPLRALKLGWCKVGKRAGAEHIAQLLQFNETLEEVDLRGNNLCDNGAMIVGRSLRQMQSAALARLDLGYNEIEDDGAFTLANAMKNNPENMPELLLLTQNYISNAGKVAVQEAMEDLFEMYEKEMTIEF